VDLGILESQAKSEEEIHQEEREKYQAMFGSIIVPTYSCFDEPEAPSPLVYVVTDKEGEIEAIRRPRRDSNYGRWAFEELDRGVIRTQQASAEHIFLVIAADKNLRRDRFIQLAKDLAQKSGRGQVWIQVWGVHPDPIQIPIELGDEALLRSFEDCENLQHIVDRLCEIPVQDATSQSGREQTNRNAEQGVATNRLPVACR
jgi:hypothetical protein